MPKIKAIDTEKSNKVSDEEKIISTDDMDVSPEIEEKPEAIIPIIEEEEDELIEDDPLIDSEEIDPFGDTWEQ